MLELTASSNRSLEHRLSAFSDTSASCKAAETDETFYVSGVSVTEEVIDPDVVRDRLDSFEIS